MYNSRKLRTEGGALARLRLWIRRLVALKIDEEPREEYRRSIQSQVDAGLADTPSPQEGLRQNVEIAKEALASGLEKGNQK